MYRKCINNKTVYENRYQCRHVNHSESVCTHASGIVTKHFFWITQDNCTYIRTYLQNHLCILQNHGAYLCTHSCTTSTSVTRLCSARVNKWRVHTPESTYTACTCVCTCAHTTSTHQILQRLSLTIVAALSVAELCSWAMLVFSASISASLDVRS